MSWRYDMHALFQMAYRQGLPRHGPECLCCAVHRLVNWKLRSRTACCALFKGHAPGGVETLPASRRF
jgi:hypothetical protein